MINFRDWSISSNLFDEALRAKAEAPREEADLETGRAGTADFEIADSPTDRRFP